MIRTVLPFALVILLLFSACTAGRFAPADTSRLRVATSFYPVWLLNTTWNGEKYTFAMNGQTGKFVGNLPLDKSAATKWTVGLAAALSAAACGIAWLLHFAGIL